MNIDERCELAEILFPNITKTREYYEKMYPERNLPEGAMVTRYGPSPTGSVHLGNLYSAFCDMVYARQSKGVFFLRIEDTDQKRMVEGGIENITGVLNGFNILPSEGYSFGGEYGPYQQSERTEIYQTYVKDLIKQGLAYPCFMTEEELANIREEQEINKVRTGVYGIYAADRDLSLEEIKEKLSNGEEYVIRLKSPGDASKTIEVVDCIKGKMKFPEHDTDIVLLKKNGIPTYHFAHVVDDHLMKTTIVIRGDEWLSSIPVHLQMFATMGWEPPKYAHISPIMKKEGDTKRKLSKRKDPEAAVSYYFEEGYPNVAVTEYLLNIANSSFEPWRRANPTLPYTDFTMKLSDMNASGALFDLVKLSDISKDVISKMSGEEVYEKVFAWAEKFDKELFELLSRDKKYAIKIFSIEKGGNKPRKDIAKWSDVKDQISYFFDDKFDGKYDFSEKVSEADRKEIVKLFLETYSYEDDKQTWFDKIKAICDKTGFASNNKDYKANPENYKGNVSDVSNVIRAALTGRQMSPDMYEIMQVMGKDATTNRLKKIL